MILPLNYRNHTERTISRRQQAASQTVQTIRNINRIRSRYNRKHKQRNHRPFYINITNKWNHNRCKTEFRMEKPAQNQPNCNNHRKFHRRTQTSIFAI